MTLSVGIVGLPNVGKSTLFETLTSQTGLSANYPFATIDANKGIVPVPDSRLQVLADIAKSAQIIPATVEFVDIAGLVKGASQGEGLGNKFLANIRECTVIVEVLRYFSDPNVEHTSGAINPQNDADLILYELIMADLSTLEKAQARLAKESKHNDKAAKQLDIVNELVNWLGEAKPALTYPFVDSEQSELVNELSLLSMKPIIYVANVDEENLSEAPAAISGQVPLAISAKVESELGDLTVDERAAYLAELGVAESGLERLVHTAYATLGLQSFFTAGPKEARSWTIHCGDKAPAAAGVIHTDFAKGFIKADVIAFDDYVACQGEAGARAAGKLRSEGKDYVMQEGDVVHFKFNV